MKRLNPAWYVVAVVLVLGPAVWRMSFWPTQRPQQIDVAAAKAGEVLFKHQWKPNDPLAKGGDGLGPVFNAVSCVACHKQGGVGGAGANDHNVTTFIAQSHNPLQNPREGVVHALATSPQFRETLQHVHHELPAISQPSLDQLLANVIMRNGVMNQPVQAKTRPFQIPAGVSLSQRNTPALFGARLIDELPERFVIAQERQQRVRHGMAPTKEEDSPVGRAMRLPDGRVGKFGWKGQSASLFEFVQAACANELGLGNPGAAQPKPLGAPNYQPPGLDLTTEQCKQMTMFIASLPQPVEKAPEDRQMRMHAEEGKKHFLRIGCADCHVPSIGSIEGIYSDLLMHRMGQDLEGTGSYNSPRFDVPDSPGNGAPLPDEWRTPPLWGVADSAPYLHDGRAASLEDAIRMHGGQGQDASRRFQSMTPREQAQLVEFLKSLRAPAMQQ